MQRVPGLTLKPKEEIASNEDQCQYTLTHTVRDAMNAYGDNSRQPKRKTNNLHSARAVERNAIYFQWPKKCTRVQTEITKNSKQRSCLIICIHLWLLSVNYLCCFRMFVFGQKKLCCFRLIRRTENGQHFWSAFISINRFVVIRKSLILDYIFWYSIFNASSLYSIFRSNAPSRKLSQRNS